MRMDDTRLTKKILLHTLKLKTTTTWTKQVKIDLEKAKIKITDTEDRKKYRQKIHDWEVASEIKHRTTAKWTEERRTQHSERMKKYWENKKNNRL